MNDLSIGDEDDDDAALEAMIAKELGEFSSVQLTQKYV